MPAAARVLDLTDHPGIIDGPGVPNVRIGGSPAAIAGDSHTCSWPPPSGPHPKSKLLTGSETVRIGGKPAVRVGDHSACGARVVTGVLNVSIG